MRLFSVLVRCIAVIVLVPVVLWAVGVFVYAGPSMPALADACAIVVALAGIGAILGLFVRRLRPALYVLAACLVATGLWWSSIRPSNDRQWQTDVSVLPWAEVDGDRVVFHNVRNFDYRTETDYTPAWYDHTYDLGKLDEVDIIAVYWMGDDIAHIMLSFGFGGEDYLAVSIETRKEVGESYSTLAGFFRRYELFYVVADERDSIRLRTNYRKDPPEDVYVYQVNAPRENARRLFLDYVREINELRDHAKFYNTLTTNCTTSIWTHAQVNPHAAALSWKVLASGHVPSYLYDIGRLDTRLPFEELRRRSRINDVAHGADKAADFSQVIRKDLPHAPVSP